LRSGLAIARQLERENNRQKRLAQKQAELDFASETVEEFDLFIQDITSLHREVSIRKVNWDALANDPGPETPIRTFEAEDQVRRGIARYKPSFFTMLFGYSKKHQKRLEQEMEAAQQKDEKRYQQELKRYQLEQQENENTRMLAAGVLAYEPKAMAGAVDRFGQFGKIDFLGKHIEFTFSDEFYPICQLHVFGEELVPVNKRALRQSGTLVTKNMPKAEAKSIYRQHVCSAVLRTARELFQILPSDSLIVNAEGDLLNQATGHIETKTILSVFFVRKTLLSLNMNQVDPVQAIDNFLSQSSFKKLGGFAAVDQVNVPEFGVSSV
jgi:hypothetical protein